MKNHTLKTIFYSLITLSLAFSFLAYADEKPLHVIKDMSEQFEKEFLLHQDEIKKDASIADDLINKHLAPNVNFPLMSRYVLGKNWKKANKKQQTEFVRLFKLLLTRFYSKAFIDYLKENTIKKGMINFLPYREKKGTKYAKVKTEIKVDTNKPAIRVKYSLYNSKTNGWKIYDISVEGVSLVTSYRSTFKQLVSKEKMSGLLAHLQNKINSF